MSDCIVAQITANRKTLLAAISTPTYSFTPAAVEEQRLMLSIGGRFPYILLQKLPISPTLQNNDSEETDIEYVVSFYDAYNDSSGDEITYKYRNVIADITKAWMADKTCAGLAEGTWRVEYHEGIMPDDKGNLFFIAWAVFIVKVFVDSLDPYKGGL